MSRGLPTKPSPELYYYNQRIPIEKCSDVMSCVCGGAPGISIGCFALRSVCNGMALVRVPAIVQVVSFYPVGLLLGGGLAMRGAPFLGKQRRSEFSTARKTTALFAKTRLGL